MPAYVQYHMMHLQTRPVLNPEQIRAADAYTIRQEPIASIELMERASEAFTQRFLELYPAPGPVMIICGTGNNGGDGLAVARLLKQQGHATHVWIAGDPEQGSTDFKVNWSRFRENGQYQLLQPQSPLPDTSSYSICIDALLGSGLSRPLEGWLAQLIEELNEAAIVRVALDMPSGLFADKRQPANTISYRADTTISFEVAKEAFFYPESDPFVGDWHLVDIGLQLDFLPADVITRAEVVGLQLPSRGKHSHKGQHGHALMLVGSHGKIGAGVLSARAGLRAGLGLLTVATPACGYNAMQVAVPEAMVITDTADEILTQVPDQAERYSCLGIGPGIGQHKLTAQMLQHLLESYGGKLVLDADALNILAHHRHLLGLLAGRAILSPHPGEFKRLVGDFRDSFESIKYLADFAHTFDVTILLKGAYTVVASPDGQLTYNSTGNPGMGTAGSGDVLTGIITALSCKTDDLPLATRAAVYLHGLAGDLAMSAYGQESMIASDIIKLLPNAIRSCQSNLSHVL